MTELGKVQFGERLTRRQEVLRSALTSGPGIAWITFWLFIPLLAVVAMSFASRGTYGGIEWHFTFANFKRFSGFGAFGFDPLYPRILLRSMAMAAGTVALCVLAGLPLSFFIAGLPKRSRQAALMLVVIPFWTNLLIRTYAWQVVLAGTGWLAQAAASLGLVGPGEALYPSAGAVFLGLTCDYLPFLTLPLYASVEKIDWRLAEAAADLGADRWRVFWHALLPQIKPGLCAGAIMVFIAATGQFVIPDLLGGAKTVLLGNAVQQQFGFSQDWPFGSALACLAMMLVMLSLWAFARTAGEEGAKSPRMKRLSLPLWLTAGVLYLFLYTPIAVVIVYSFNSARHGGPWISFTTRWYGTLFSSAEKLEAVRNTLILATVSTAISTVLGTSLGYGLSRYRFPGKALFSWLMYIPVMIPDIVMAVAMLMFYSLVRSKLGLLELGLTTMIIAHITFQIPFIALVVRSRLAGLDPALEEAAHDLGATPAQKFRYVTWPLIFPGVLAGAALAFTLSIDDFVVSFFTCGPGATTLPILIYSSVKRGITPDINALSTLIVLASVIGTLTVGALQRRGRIGAS